jgi:hypothetical protein
MPQIFSNFATIDTSRTISYGFLRVERALTEMTWITLPLLFILNTGPSMHWGDVNAGIQAPLLWSAGMGIFVVLAGWRTPNNGLFTSMLLGMALAAIINMPAYFLGQWLTASFDCAWFGSSFGSWLDTAFGPAIKQLACRG